jgi:hypothetical protein
MAITGMDGLVNAMGNNSSRIIINKASLANLGAGAYYSLWRATGQPGQGAVPTTPAVCSNTLVGCFGYTQQTSPATSYLGQLEAISVNASVTVEIQDRLMHCANGSGGALSGATAAVQAITGMDLSTNLGTSNLAARIGDSNYSDVQWWMEWYADTGATASNATVNVTFNDGTTGNLALFAVGGTVRAARLIPLNPLIQAADSGKYIRGINSLTLSGTGTGGAGSLGFTATRYRGAVYCPTANGRFIATWADVGMPEIYNSSCLFPAIMANATTSGTINGTGKILHG